MVILGKCDEEKTKIKSFMEGLGNERTNKTDLAKVKSD
jgi:hypothetical protein